MTATSPAADTPHDAVAAVTHRDPYPYYAQLVEERPLFFDDSLRLWIGSSAAAVTAVLSHPSARVRPPSEPVPATIVGSPAGALFGRLARMTDGDPHATARGAATQAIDAFEPTRVAGRAEEVAAALAVDIDACSDAIRLTDFAFTLPAAVIASLLGFPDAALHDLSRRIGDLVRCIFPGGTADQIERGRVAAEELLERVRDVAPAGATEVVLANLLGLLAQAYDATAGLIATTLLTIARQPQLQTHALVDVLEEVLRFDAPVQNTRRFFAADATILGQLIGEGDAVLVVLAAANRDPRANSHPHRFVPTRAGRQTFTFGVGVHACPGRGLAVAIACAAIERLRTNGVEVDRLDPAPTYRVAPNVRIPNLAWKQ
jgi:cytochrome P450